MKNQWLARWVVLIPCMLSVPANCAEQSLGRPNVLWITGEDMSAKWLGCYGNKQIQTPNFDKLAQDGFLYTRCHAHVPVCAPARSGWVTGIHPVSMGTIYMRSLYEIPTSLIWYPDALRANGYFAGNFTKTDYNTSNRKVGGFGGGKDEGSVGHFENTWDSYEDSWWQNPKRGPNQPFFQVMRDGLKNQQTTIHDCGFLPEGILVQRAKHNQTTIYDLIRDPKLYDQQGYMKAADVANFAKPSDLPKLVELLKSSDEGYRYWGVVGCIQLGERAATPEVLKLIDDLIESEIKDERTLDVRVTAALYGCQTGHGKDAALRSLAEVIAAPGKSMAKGRAWANVFLLGAEAKSIEGLLQSMKPGKNELDTLALFLSKI